MKIHTIPYFFPGKRFVFFAGPEGQEVQRQGATPEQQSEYEDPAKRHEMYRKADQKAAEMEASGDSRKAEWAKRLRERTSAARESERKYDSSMAITEAYGLRDTLRTLANMEAVGAKNLEEQKNRDDLYRQAREKIAEYRASDDPFKHGRADALERNVNEAMSYETGTSGTPADKPMAITTAFEIRRGLQMLARREMQQGETSRGEVRIGKVDVKSVPRQKS